MDCRWSRRVAALALALAACGGSRDGADSTSTLAVDPAVAPFCDAFGELLSGPLATGELDVNDPEVLRTAVEVTLAAADQLRDTAPAPVAASAAALAEQYHEAFAVLERYGYDLTRFEAEATPEDRAVLDAFGQPPSGPNIANPFADVETFVADTCAPGLTIPPDLTGTTSP